MSPETVIDVVGATPLVRLEHLVPHNGSEVWVKLEGNNPAGQFDGGALCGHSGLWCGTDPLAR